MTRRVSIGLRIVSALDSDPKPIDGKRVSPTAGHHPGTQCLFWSNSKNLGFFLNFRTFVLKCLACNVNNALIVKCAYC